MDTVPITPEREALANDLEWDRQDYDEAVEGIREGYEDVKAGRTQPVEDMLEELRIKDGLPQVPKRSS
jgi:predicted transcriptional regulator